MTLSKPSNLTLLDGKAAIVTGAGRGIGAAIATRLAQAGARVCVADIDEAAAMAVAAQIGGVGVAIDVANETSTDVAMATSVEQLGRLDIVVANAGVLHLAPVIDMELGQWQRVIEINLTGAFLTVRAAARRLVEQDSGGRIILMSSLFGTRGGVENAAYSASKFGVVGLTQSLAAELAPRGITVNAVCPGQVDTEMMENLFQSRAQIQGTTSEAVRAQVVGRVPAGRMASVDEIADTIVYLASPMASYVTGQSLIIDGGLTVG